MAIEGEWPDAAAVNRFVHGDPGAPATAEEAQRAFTTGFPEWMRLTEMGQGGEHNVGQLMRQTYAARSFLLGFTTYHRTVLAAQEWDSPGRVDRLWPALPGSYFAHFREAAIPAFLLIFRGNQEVS